MDLQYPTSTTPSYTGHPNQASIYDTGEDALRLAFPNGSTGNLASDSSMTVDSHENFGGSEYTPSPLSLYNFPPHTQYQQPPVAIPIELGIEGLHEDLDRRLKRRSSDKTGIPPVNSRRRVQNRVAQRTFRDRKEKHMKEVEQRLQELEGRYDILSASYETLRKEYLAVTKELQQTSSAEEDRCKRCSLLSLREHQPDCLVPDELLSDDSTQGYNVFTDERNFDATLYSFGQVAEDRGIPGNTVER
ncbi:MAG: hypothetical protein M1818_004188 [Claussenomyces sp. TS43310]|nr:MAG: hypothetical protein M1818_004188 [Claussenomyces sp. TS43310]